MFQAGKEKEETEATSKKKHSANSEAVVKTRKQEEQDIPLQACKRKMTSPPISNILNPITYGGSDQR